ncbi:4-alpha-glucanotransferase [Simiduia sp. 21SJ11W-1]|uniref:4-alpha-glucanotransferase n=1 Tax=Simiduia sp. 21SJ11W-1 TaxID=2909669 RepID=UPI00209CFD13|nr:4-alpha-glucanotransferase [Simiduia sp. 21SJ11W-1]UTA46379.1 4-alpha-glucanotransferase [Simiduia sp. 21SJ11W-1]
MSDTKYVSTTALAKQLGKEPKEVFVLLARAHWMVKVDDRWQLTEKGKFEGGIYLTHPKYGEYVGWPEAVLQHGIWDDLPEAPLTASQLGQKLGLPARLLNLLLADLGWQAPGPKGWVLTESGRRLGGQQQRAEDSGVPYVTWPETLTSLARLTERAECLRHGGALDGRPQPDAALGRLGNWLYLQGFTYGFNRADLGSPVPVSCYVPRVQLAIAVWSPSDSAEAIKLKLEQQQWLKSARALELDAAQLSDIGLLDALLPPLLLDVGVAVY